MNGDELDLPAGAVTSSDPIEGGILHLNAAVPVDHPDHALWRAPVNAELTERARLRRATQAQEAQRLRAHLRLERNRLLLESDWTQGPDAPLTPDQVAAYAAWRQQLRDFPLATVDPANPPDWPAPPTPAPADEGATAAVNSTP